MDGYRVQIQWELDEYRGTRRWEPVVCTWVTQPLAILLPSTSTHHSTGLSTITSTSHTPHPYITYSAPRSHVSPRTRPSPPPAPSTSPTGRVACPRPARVYQDWLVIFLPANFPPRPPPGPRAPEARRPARQPQRPLRALAPVFHSFPCLRLVARFRSVAERPPRSTRAHLVNIPQTRSPTRHLPSSNLPTPYRPSCRNPKVSPHSTGP